MKNKLSREILNKLLDSYEHSTLFLGENKNNRLPQIAPEKLYPKYADDAEYDFFLELNDAVTELEKEGLVVAERGRGNVVKRVLLPVENIDAAYEALGRESRVSVQEKIRSLLTEIIGSCSEGHLVFDCDDSGVRSDSGCDNSEKYLNHDGDVLKEYPRFDSTDVENHSYFDYADPGADLNIDHMITEGYSKFENAQMILPLAAYAREQINRIDRNKNVEYFDRDLESYADMLRMTREVLINENECFIRDFSIRLFGDSKKAESYRGKVESLLFSYGDYAEKNSILEEHGILKTPAYVMLKGAAKICFEKETINLRVLGGDIGLSTESLKNVKSVEVIGHRVITVENLTSFHDYVDPDALVIYLGGFHNRAKRELLKLIYAGNQDKEYRHFGDIDAGGFYILEHLKMRTGIPFKMLFMDKESLINNRDKAKKLTANDVTRLKKLREKIAERLGSYAVTGDEGTENVKDTKRQTENIQMNDSVQTEDGSAEYECAEYIRISEVIDYMLAEGIKLEQESVLF